MGARSGGGSGGGGASFGSGASLPDKDMGVVIKRNPLETLMLNRQLQAKNAKGNVFQVAPNKYWQAGPRDYGLYIEGKGWVKLKNQAVPYMLNRKSLVSELQKSGFTGYENIEFVNPINK